MITQEIIQACINGDKRSQNMLYRAFSSMMGRLCLRYLKNEEDARDTLIEGFLKVFNNLDKFEYRGQESLEVWIRRIMINECLMQLRKNKKLVFLSVSEGDSISNSSSDESIAAEEVYRIVTQLPDGYRTIFNLYAMEGYSHKEIAQLLGITESASRSQLSHAREKLRDLLKNKGWK